MRSLEYLAKWFVCALALSMAGCAGWHAWTACELGQLPQITQTLIPAVVQALEQGGEGAALAALEAIGSSLAEGQLECIVEAIAADTQKKALPNATTILRNAAVYRSKHTARLKCDRA